MGFEQAWTYCAGKLTEKRWVFSCDLKLDSLSMADRKWKPIPDDRANIRKSALLFDILASDRNAEDA